MITKIYNAKFTNYPGKGEEINKKFTSQSSSLYRASFTSINRVPKAAVDKEFTTLLLGVVDKFFNRPCYTAITENLTCVFPASSIPNLRINAGNDAKIIIGKSSLFNSLKITFKTPKLKNSELKQHKRDITIIYLNSLNDWAPQVYKLYPQYFIDQIVRDNPKLDLEKTAVLVKTYFPKLLKKLNTPKIINSAENLVS